MSVLDVMPCSLVDTNISEVTLTSFFGAEESFTLKMEPDTSVFREHELFTLKKEETR
jgi:hypothetical protein